MMLAAAVVVQTTDPLNYTVADNPFFDLLRVLTALAGILMFIMATVRWLQHQRFWSGMSFMAFGVLAAFQEVQQIGEPFLVWRCPILFIGCICGIRYLYYTLDQIKQGPDR